MARARPDSWFEEEVERRDPDHSSLSEARRDQLSRWHFHPLHPLRRRQCGESESEARGRGSGERLAGTSGSGGLCERRFFFRGPAETGGVTASASNKASRAHRVDIGSSLQSSQPHEDIVTAAWSRPRQRAQITSVSQRRAHNRSTAIKGYCRRIAKQARMAEGGEDGRLPQTAGFLRRFPQLAAGRKQALCNIRSHYRSTPTTGSVG
ncbi:hypothetical protein PO909_000885 [Leuciscus waleckii]